MMTRLMGLVVAFVIVAAVRGAPAGAQPAPADSVPPSVVTRTTGEPATLMIANRPVFVFRADFLGHPPVKRMESALQRLDDASLRGDMAVTTNRTDIGVIVAVDGQMIFTITPGDVDPLSGQTFDNLIDVTRRDVEEALAAHREQRSLDTLVHAILMALLATVIMLRLVQYLRRFVRWASRELQEHAARRVERLKVAPGALGHQVIALVRFTVRVASAALFLLIIYSWLAFVLDQFPYTSPWADQLGHYLSRTVGTVLLAIVRSVPGLLMVVIIFGLARIVVRWIRILFDAAREGRLDLYGVDADTAPATQRLVVIFIWVLAIALAFPFIPGSGGPAFQGISVLLGLMVSLGASNVVAQAASGYILMYSRSLRIGDYVRIADYEGTVISMSMLSTKLRTPRDEEINVPNAVVIGSITKNYSRLTRDTGAVLTTSVTIGYATPWRQVHAMLTEAAERTTGLRKDARPHVLQSALSDFYVEYTLAVRLERPDTRLTVSSALHANIQDVFNHYGVQIMSPHYESDPAAKVWVPRERWNEPPADRGV